MEISRSRRGAWLPISRLTWLGAVAGLAMGMAVPAQASTRFTGAEKLQHLNVMLKVSGSRCEAQGVNMRSAYANFAHNHRFVLTYARQELRNQLAAQHGEVGAEKAYAQITYMLADQYRLGHPWLTCGDLKTALRGLAMVEGPETLLEAANQLLPNHTSPTLVALRR